MTIFDLYNRYIRGFTDADRQQLGRIERMLDAVLNQGATELINVTALLAAVERETAIDKSVLALVQGLAKSQADLSQQLKDAIAANDPVAMAAVQKAIDDSVAAITANADSLSAAVTANTEVAPTV